MGNIYIPSRDVSVPELCVPGKKPVGNLKIKDKYKKGMSLCEIFRGNLVNLADNDIPTAEPGPSYAGKYWEFTGSNSEIDYGAHSELEGATEFTIICKVHSDIDNADQTIVSKLDSSSWWDNGFMLFRDESGPSHTDTWEIFTSNSSTYERLSSGNSTAAANTWYTLATSYKAQDQLRLWHEGTEVSGSPLSLSGGNANVGANDDELVIGTASTGAKDLDGGIEFVYVWNRRLPEAEILKICRDPYGELFEPAGPEYLILSSAEEEVSSTYFYVPSKQILTPELYVPGRKPIGLVEIDWSNTITHNLYAVYLFQNNKVYNLKDNIETDEGFELANVSQRYDGHGSYMHCNNEGIEKETGYTAPLTLTVIGKTSYENTTSDHTLFCHGNQNLLIWADTSASNIRPGVYAGGTARYGSNNFTANTPYIWGASCQHSSANTTIYMNGEAQVSGDAGPFYSTSATSYIGTNHDNSKSTLGNIYFLYIWERLLTAKEHFEIYRNPYQILKPIGPEYLTFSTIEEEASSTYFYVPSKQILTPELLIPGKKPVGPVELRQEFDNPLSDGALLRDKSSLKGKHLTVDNESSFVAKGLNCPSGTGAGFYWDEDVRHLWDPDTGTMFLGFIRTGTTANLGALLNIENNTNSLLNEVQINLGGADCDALLNDNAEAAKWDFGVWNTIFPLNTEVILTLAYDRAGDYLRGYLDGIQSGSRGTTGVWGQNDWSAGNGRLAVGGRSVSHPSGTYSAAGIVTFFYYTKDVLSDARIYSISKNPYGELFEPAGPEYLTISAAAAPAANAPTGALYGPLAGPLGGPI